VTRICVREAGSAKDGFRAAVTIDDGPEYGISVCSPFDEAEEDNLRWYFESHLRRPFTDQVRAEGVAQSVTRYGEELFAQLFGAGVDAKLQFAYHEAEKTGMENLAFEIVGSPAFHALHWETLKAPNLPQPFSVRAPMVRRNLKPTDSDYEVRASATINLLVVSARPGGARDVAYRTISRPLIEMLENADARVRVDIVRPGTYDALESRLGEKGSGYYHIVHFDTHGSLLTWEQYLKAKAGEAASNGPQDDEDEHFYTKFTSQFDLKEYAGAKAFLAFEGNKPGEGALVEADRLADLLRAHQVPVAILNACQSGMQQGTAETSLGSQLVQRGLWMAVGMSYSVTVSAAQVMMKALYEQLFAGSPLSSAIRRGRQELYREKSRRAFFGQEVELEDWILPVVYQNKHDVGIPVRAFEEGEAAEYYGPQAKWYRAPKTPYGFFGRDLDILSIERRLLRKGDNLLLIQGLGGAGKTTLMHHLGAWWEATGFVDKVFYFGYDAKAWTCDQIMDSIAKEVWSAVEYAKNYEPLNRKVQREELCQHLRAHRHLVILDNLESITGTNLAIANPLNETEQEDLREFLSRLNGGKSFVLLGSRGGETWLAKGTFEENVHELGGLDPEAASQLASQILAKHGATKYETGGDETYFRLLRLLGGTRWLSRSCCPT